MLVFALLVILIFNFALELVAWLASVTSGVLWVTFSFGTLGLNRSMATEKDRGCLDGLLSCSRRPLRYLLRQGDRQSGMLIVEIIILPVYSVLYNTNLFNPGLVMVILLGSIGYVTVGTLLSTMAVQTCTRDILLPILLFPIVIPVLIAAVKASSGFLQALELSEIIPYLNFLVVYDIIFVAIAFMLFDYVVEEDKR